MEPISIAVAVAGVIFGAGFAREWTTRDLSLKDQGQNDITEENCDALCRQLRTRWNELCLALSDETYMRDRWQQAALASVGAAAAALALQLAAQAALASIFGIVVGLALAAAAVLAVAVAVAAAGFASSALDGFNRASTDANNRRRAFSEARAQLANTCGEEQAAACNNRLPSCP